MSIEPLRSTSVSRGFSLVEVLLAILILGIGIVSIAALFPAGIAQQRLSNDDVMGPIVANSAMSIIRSKVRQEDFGTIEQFEQFLPSGVSLPQAYFSRTIPGDWPWMRPGVLLQDDGSTNSFNERGALDIFSRRYTLQRWEDWDGPDIDTASDLADGWPDETVWQVMSSDSTGQPLQGVPYNTDYYGNNPPNFIISQRERYYPMQSAAVNSDEQARPQYVWDCMFRRYQGRVHVAIFVYRVSSNNSAAYYEVQADPVAANFPPLPYKLDFINPPTGTPYGSGARSVWYDANDRPQPYVLGAENANEFENDPDRIDLSWQRTRQWVLDQNNNVHRVVGVQRDPDNNNQLRVELTRPLQPVMRGWWENITDNLMGLNVPFNEVEFPSDTPNYYYGDPSNSILGYPNMDRGVLTEIWYIPRNVTVVDPNTGVETEFTLTPVYLTVKEL